MLLFYVRIKKSIGSSTTDFQQKKSIHMPFRMIG